MVLKNNNITVLAVLLITCVLIGVIAILAFPEAQIGGDGARYDTLALSLLNERSYIIIEDFILAPGYPFFLVFNYFLFGHNYNAVFFFQFLILGLNGWLVYLIGAKHLKLSQFMAIGAALATILWPYLILYAKLLMSEVLFTCALTASVYFYLELTRRSNIKYSLLAGLFLGIATLIRPIPLLLPAWFAFFLILFSLFNKQKLNKNKLYILITTIFIFISVLSPWVIFASNKTGKFVPVTSTLGVVYNGANKSYLSEWSHYKTPGYEPGTPVVLSKILTIKVKNFFRFWRSGARGYQMDALINKYPATKYIIFLFRFYHYFIITLMLLSIFFIRKNRTIIVLWLVILYFWLLHSVLHTQPRYTLPVIPLAILLATYTLFNHKVLLNKFFRS